MKKLFLSVIGMYIGILAAFSQDSRKADSAYKPKKLTFEEANIVSSYYSQDGNHSAVTGGTGTERLTDISNVIDLKFSLYDRKYRKHTFTTELGVDHYTSASSDKIDPKTISSASHADTRFYPSVNWAMENEVKGTSFGAGLSGSTEFDYHSFGANLQVTKKTNDKSGEFTAKAQAFLDQVSLVYPIELRTNVNSRGNSYSTASRNTFSGTVSWSQIINRQFQLMFEGEAVYQQGYLGLPFHRVYFNDNSVHVEHLPSTRLKIPFGIRANYFIGDKFIVRTWLRDYRDDWGIHSDALQLEAVYKITPFISLTPFYRFYKQTAVDYFSPFGVHTSNDPFYTSNFDLSGFNSDFYGAGLRMAPPNGVLETPHFNALEIRYGHYQKTTGMNANIISMNLKFK